MFRLLVITLTGALLCWGCSKPPEVVREVNDLPEDVEIVEDIEPGKYGGVFVLAYPQPPKTFNPLITVDAYSSYAIGPFLGSLINYDWVKQKLIPGLAKNWEMAEDKLTYTVHLRKGVKWSDGVPFTADDVIFSLDSIFDDRYPNRTEYFLTYDGKRINYRKIDKYTVEFKTPMPRAAFIQDLAFVSLIPKHKLYKYFKDGTLLKAWTLETATNKPEELVGLGPFRVRKFVTGERIIFEPNPYYWRVDINKKRLPYIDFVIHKYVPDQNTLLVLFSTGQTDSESFDNRDRGWVEKAAKKYNFSIYNRGPGAGITFFWFNQKPGKNKKGEYYVEPYKLKWFQDKRFRQAISYAIDREGILNAIALGQGVPLSTIIGPANKKWYNPDTKKYPYDIEQAKALFKSMGFYYDKEGKLFDAQGHRVEFELLASEGGESRISTAIKENLEEVGIHMELTFLDFATMIEKTGSTYMYEASIMGLSGGIPDPSAGKDVYKSEGRMHFWNPEQEKPATKWEARVDELMDLQAQEMDETKRIAYIHEMQDIYSEEVPAIFLVMPNDYTGIKNKWQNIKIPSMGSVLWNMDELWADGKVVKVKEDLKDDV